MQFREIRRYEFAYHQTGFKTDSTLHLAVQCGLRKNANSKIGAFYDKKRKEGKP